MAKRAAVAADGGDPDDVPGPRPVPAWSPVMRAANRNRQSASEFLAMDPYDQAIVYAQMEVERRVGEAANKRSRGRKG